MTKCNRQMKPKLILSSQGFSGRPSVKTERKHFLAPFFTIYGRMSRVRYLKYLLSLWATPVLSFILSLNSNTNDATGVFLISGIIAIFFSIPLICQRLHDTSHSAASFFICSILLPGFGVCISAILLMFVTGTIGPNRYGEDPLGPQTIYSF